MSVQWCWAYKMVTGRSSFNPPGQGICLGKVPLSHQHLCNHFWAMREGQLDVPRQLWPVCKNRLVPDSTQVRGVPLPAVWFYPPFWTNSIGFEVWLPLSPPHHITPMPTYPCLCAYVYKISQPLTMSIAFLICTVGKVFDPGLTQIKALLLYYIGLAILGVLLGIPRPGHNTFTIVTVTLYLALLGPLLSH